MAVRRILQSARIGVLPFPCDQMSTTWVDEFGLRARYGVQLRHLELERVRRFAAESTSEEVSSFREAIARSGARVEVDERNLQEGIRYAHCNGAPDTGGAALRACDERRDPGNARSLRPATLPVQSQAVFVRCRCVDGSGCRCLNCDARAATVHWRVSVLHGTIFRRLRAEYDFNGPCRIRTIPVNADLNVPVGIISDVEYENSDLFTGAVNFFKYKPGPVTAVNSVWDGEGLRWCCCEGESLPGPVKLEGNCHMLFRPAMPVKEFSRRVVEIGVSRHWLFIPGLHAVDLSTLCSILRVGFMRVDHY